MIIGGNASLNLMFDAVMRLYVFGTMGEKPWGQLDKVKFLCRPRVMTDILQSVKRWVLR